MNKWLSAITTQHGPSILVTVAHAEGSVPREAGAKMLVTPTQQFDTIGGGHLEFCAIEFARNMLALSGTASQKRLERFPLGPTLGQCCGGVVFLAFERIDATDLDFYIDLQQRWQRGEDCWRLVALDTESNGVTPPLLVSPLDPHDTHPVVPNLNLELDAPCRLLRDEQGKRWMLDPCLSYRTHLYLFGAGHVGAALIRALAELPCRVTWIDERAELFPSALPDNVRCEVTDAPEALIDSAPADASYLVMTHSHALDQHLA
ncbi:MAG: xanthine dehydrogenase accessory protein XdhC, partial [Burkholderiaceae bacterium]